MGNTKQLILLSFLFSLSSATYAYESHKKSKHNNPNQTPLPVQAPIVIPPIVYNPPAPTPTPPTPTPTKAPVVTPSIVYNGTGATLFPSTEIWYKKIDTETVDMRSSNVIADLAKKGFGSGKFQVQVANSFHILKADSATPKVNYVENAPGPDCDQISQVPLPAGGSLEGEKDYTCAGGGDCHLIVHDTSAQKLYEIWTANYNGNVVTGSCAIVWDLNQNYWPQSDLTFSSKGRGDQCTSADAAGFPISALLTSADEVFNAIAQGTGDVGHALRFILPNSTMKKGVFIHPATHAGGPSSAAQDAIPYGTRLRLKSTFDLTKLPNEAARVLARTMMKYGLFLADGGIIAMNLQDDKLTTHKWSEWNFSQLDLVGLTPNDFEMVNGGPEVKLTYDCVRVK